MARQSSIVSIVLQLQELRKFLEGTNQAAKGVEHVGTQSQAAGKKAAIGWKGIAKWAGGAALIYGATRYVHSAVDALTTLTKSTIALQVQTGLDTETASEWVGVLKERNIAVKTFQVGLKTTAKAMEAARLGTDANSQAMSKLREQYRLTMLEGGKKAAGQLLALQKRMDALTGQGDKARGMFAKIGVTQAELRKGNTGEVLLKIADALHGMSSASERSALVTTLLGRSGTQLLPLLSKGSGAIQEQLDVQKQYGNYLKGSGIDSLADLIKKERELKAAQEGMKIQLGLALLPAMQAFTDAIVKLARLFAPLIKNVWLFYGVLFALVAVLIALKVAMVVATFAAAGLSAAVLIWAGVIVLIVIAIIGLALLFLYLYKHVTWFHNAVDAVFNWIKTNWPLLLAILGGPFTALGYLIYRQFSAIKSFVVGIVKFIRQIVDDVIHYIASIPKRLGGVLKKVPGVGLALKTAGGAAHVAGGVFGAITGRAGGGIMQPGETTLVGERGPELLSAPGGTVTPLAGLAGGGYLGEVVVPVYLDGREIARSVARIAADKAARR